MINSLSDRERDSRFAFTSAQNFLNLSLLPHSSSISASAFDWLLQYSEYIFR